MASCVHEVLQGNVSVAEVKAWLAQPCPVPPAPFSGGPDSPCSPSRLGSLINVTPEQFRVLVLNHVKEEAEAIFAAAEQQAAAAQHQATSAQHPKPICTSHQKPTAPGAVSDMAFPALPVHSDKKKALDRRLSTRQLDLQSAPDLAPAKRSSHKKKIAPTKMQPGSSSSQTFPSGIIYTAEVPASDSLSLIQEASARDLWNPAPHHVDKPNLEEQDRQHQVELQPTSSAQASTDEDSCFVTPYKLRSAWGEKSTPPSAGSTNSPTISKHPSPQTNAWAERTRQSPSASLLSRHSAPAAMTPASKAGTAAKTGKAVRNRRISPVQVRPEERSFSAVLAVGTAAGQPAFAKAAPAWSGNKLQLVNGGTSGCTLSGIHPALENRLASPSTPQSCNPCDSSTDPNPFFAALPNSRGNSNDSPSGHPISNQGWSTPPLAQRSRSGKAQRGSSLGSVGWQNSSPASSQAQANTQHSSPGSTATSKPTWLHVGAQGTHMPMTPTSQADSTDTCYATPGSTIRVMQDIAQEDSPAAASPAGSALLTPGSATTSSQCAAAMSNPQGTLAGTPAALQAALPADIAAARMSQVNAEPLAEARAGSLLREEGAHNVANACLPGIDPVMTQQAGRLAELHAFILAGSASVSLAAELDLLLHLLAVSHHLICPPTAAVDHGPLFPTGAAAALYAGQVLSLSGRLVMCLGRGALGTLVEVPMIRLHMPALLHMLQQALQACEAEPSTGNAGWSGGSNLFGAGAFTQDGQRQRSQEEQRRVTNMNDCRDAWTNLMRSAANPSPAPLHPSSAPSLAPATDAAYAFVPKAPMEYPNSFAYISLRLNNPKQPDVNCYIKSAHGGDEAVMVYMQHHARRAIRALRPDNYTPFAELFVAALLQAAATGESLLDSKLEDLAKRDVAKFFRLNQRMQGQAAGQRPSHQGRYSTASDGHRSGGSSPFQSPSIPPQPPLGGHLQSTQLQSTHLQSTQLQSTQMQSTHLSFRQQLSNGTAPHRQAAALLEGDMADIAIAQHFPQAQRLFLLFLQAADSHRLNASLVRCMTSKLQQMHSQCMTETSASDASQTQRLVAQCCLASFISFFTFTAARSSGSNSFHDDSNTNSQFTPAVDLSAALLAAVVSNKLAWVVPWVTQYLRFLTHDSFTHDSNSVQQLLRQLQDLRTLPMLLPEHPDFGPTQLCLRCALDDQLEQVQEIELQDKAEIDAAWQEAVAALAQQPAEKQRLSGDSRYMQLCCPALEGARQALQGSICVGSASWDKKRADMKGIRKLTPTQPPLSPRSRFRAPANVIAAASGTHSNPEQQAVKLRLQQAFVEQYSGTEQKVKLREVVDYVTGIIAQNAVSSHVKQCIQSQAAAAAATVSAEAEQPIQQAMRQPDLDTRAASLAAFVRPSMDEAFDRVTALGVQQAMEDSFVASSRYIEQQAVRAVAALAPPSWTAHVIGTAAALVAENARQSCAQQIMHQVPLDAPKQILKQLEQALQAAAKRVVATKPKADAVLNSQIQQTHNPDSPG